MFSEPNVTLWGVTVSSVTLAALIGLIAAAALSVWLLRGRVPALRVLDVTLAAAFGAVIGGRALYVLTSWPDFSASPGDILRLTAGGLDWHGAVIGAIVAAWIACRWRAIPFERAATVGALVLPVLMILLWQGCGGWGCAYGREVDSLAGYPALLVAERRDLFGLPAPRYDTPTLGALWGVLLVVIAAALNLFTRWPGSRRLGLMIALCSLGMFILGFVRGDTAPILAGLRVDQWFDLGLCILAAVVLAIIESRRWHNARRERAV
jgi:phosphatidylglycerol:prolipoprotein diacylglycerol transferase